MGRGYSDCYFCGGEVNERRLTREVWWKDRLHLVENVPVGVCGQCGEKVVLPEIGRAIDEVLAGKRPPDHFVKVPSYRLSDPDPVG